MKKFFVIGCAALVIFGCGKVSSTENTQQKKVLDATSDADVVSVYYRNASLAGEGSTDCTAVFPVDRLVLRTDDQPTASLKKLFLGPTPDEEAHGYSALFGYATRDAVKSVTVKDGTAYVNLTDIRMVISSSSDSCASATFLASMIRTLDQFPEITRVLFAIEGDPSAFYEAFQMGCSTENDNCDKTPYQNF